jgi:2-polyprenyl-6-methoxyphenol hydroxylase-like FAD-dependent oxidoreductase
VDHDVSIGAGAELSKVLVLGGGICGLGAALLLARDGHDVTVLERDDDALPSSPEAAWARWTRKGVAQFRQPHNFMPGMRLTLEAELPDVANALSRAGAAKFDLLNPLPPVLEDHSERAIDEKLWTFTARRPTGEWVFGRAALNEPGVHVRRGERAVALLTGAPARKGIPHVTGVRTAAGETLSADLVVDATGRASRSSKLLAAIGARAPYQEETDSGFRYYTRYFSGEQPERRGPTLTVMGTISLLTLPGDNGAWSVTIFTASGDKPLEGLRQPDKWTDAVRACPLHAHWLDGEPITDVLVMGGIVDRYRRFVVDDAPVATGFAAVADAWACTNPSAGRGMTVGLLHAVRLRDVLRETPDDPSAFAERFDAVTDSDVTPWYFAQVALDRFRFNEMEALREGREPPAPADALSRDCAALLGAMMADPDLFRAALEYVGTITPIQQIMSRPDVADKVASVTQAMQDDPPPPMPGPSRQQLLEIAG